MSSRPRVISLFAGGGGSSCGYVAAGFKVLCAIEFDEDAASLYAKNFPQTKLYVKDIAEISPNEVMEECNIAASELELLDGSPPCQGFSKAGKRNWHDPRNDLFKEYVKMLNALLPQAFVMENVPGLLAGKMKVKFAQMFAALESCGYSVKVSVLNSKHYGVAQTRARVFFVGIRSDLGITPTFPRGTSAIIPAGLALKQDAANEITPEELAWISNAHSKYDDMVAVTKIGENVHRSLKVKAGFGYCRIDPCEPSPTITKMQHHFGVLHHWSHPRSLSSVEIKTLCGFPDWYTWERCDWKKATAMMGNAVMPNVAQAIASHLRRIMSW